MQARAGHERPAPLPATVGRVGGEEADELGMQLAALVARLDVDAILTEAARQLLAGSGLPVALVGHAQGGDRITIRTTAGTSTPLFDGLVVPRGHGLGGKVIALRRAQGTDDYLANPSITHDFDRPVAAESLRGMTAVPIAGTRRLHGVLYGASRDHGPIGDRAADEITRIADRAGIALDVAERATHATEVAVHEERRRLAIGLHDSVGAMLYAISAGARRLADEVADLGEIAEHARDIEDRAASAAIALRRSLRALHSTPEELALSVALSADCRAFTARTGIPAHVVTLTDLPALTPERSDALAAGVREALVNVEKHAGAATVAVTVAARDAGVMVAVADDGAGLHDRSDDTGAAPDLHSSGLGLETVAVRLARVGGHFHLGSGDDGGTTARMWVPC
jgi:signal transduction histidine kinase